jgi:hypothetical protein
MKFTQTIILLFYFRQLPYFDVIEYIVHLIQRLSYICNYCLLGNIFDNGQFSTQTLSPKHWMKTVNFYFGKFRFDFLFLFLKDNDE